jgi:hypothetical protein
MEQWLQSYIKLNALNSREIKIGNNLPVIKMPCIKDIEDIYTYLYFFSKYIELYNDKKEEMFYEITESEENILDFMLFLRFFTNVDNLCFDKSTFIFDENIHINLENIGLFMQCIKVLHHRDKKEDYYTYGNTLVDKMLKRANEAKKRIAEQKAKMNLKNKNSDDESGFAEIQSTVSGRHNSINLLNINELNYYQILDQYKRLMEIDKYMPVLNGNATEEYVKNLKHYSSKLVNEN